MKVKQLLLVSSHRSKPKFTARDICDACHKAIINEPTRLIHGYKLHLNDVCFDQYCRKVSEGIFKVPFLHGFRVLFLTKTVGRLAALCKLTQEMDPSEFIYISDQDSLFEDGVFARIWARGGNLQVARRSIIGRLHCRTPLTQRPMQS